MKIRKKVHGMGLKSYVAMVVALGGLLWFVINLTLDRLGFQIHMNGTEATLTGLGYFLFMVWLWRLNEDYYRKLDSTEEPAENDKGAI